MPALAAVRTGDTLVVPKLDRLARSVPDARDIGDTLTARGIRLSFNGSIYDPADPMGKMFFNILATFAEFEVDLLRMRTPRRHGRRPSQGQAPRQATQAHRQAADPPRSAARRRRPRIPDLAELFSVSRPTVYRVLERVRTAQA